MPIKITYTDEFRKDFKALAKKWRSLWEIEWTTWDFADFKGLLEFDPIGSFAERIDGLWAEYQPVYKVKRFYCNSLKSTTKLRLIYSYDARKEEIQFVQFIEMYAKADKENEDRARIKKYAW